MTDPALGGNRASVHRVSDPIVLIAGPTASGKSTLAIALAQKVGGEIVNADSMQIYRDLQILTARPTAFEEGLVPHHLFGIVDAARSWSVGHWLRSTKDVLADIAGRGRRAIVVGGTGLYFRALTRGLAEIPSVDDAVRADGVTRLSAIGEADFRLELAASDPAAEARIASGDRQRLVRAWSVGRATGRSLTDWQRSTTPGLDASVWQGVVLSPPRDLLHQRCEARLSAMLAAGAVDEVARLLERNLDPGLPITRALGVSALAAMLRGKISEAEAFERIVRETRRYAKRQVTWFRNQAADWARIESGDPVAQIEAVTGGRFLPLVAP